MKINVEREIDVNKVMEEVRDSLSKKGGSTKDSVTINRDVMEDVYELIKYLNTKEEAGGIAKKVDSSIDSGIRWIAGKAKYIKEQMKDVPDNKETEDSESAD